MKAHQPKEQSMNHSVSLKALATVALTLGTLACATAAHAHNDLPFAVKLNAPGVHLQVAPANAYRRPMIVQPAPIYAPTHPAYTHPAPAYAWGHSHPYYQGRHLNARGTMGDYDRDGIPNRFDRFPANPNRR